MKAYYLRMAKSSGTFWEFGDGHDSRCHALGGYVAVLMLKAVFGIERIDWAKRMVVLCSPAVRLSADCDLPVADGKLHFSIREGDSRARVDLPAGWRCR